MTHSHIVVILLVGFNRVNLLYWDYVANFPRSLESDRSLDSEIGYIPI